MKTNTPVSTQLMSFISSNPIRSLIYNDNVTFGVSIVVFLTFIFSGIISDEKLSNTINLVQTQPISTFKIILSKWLSIMIYGITFVFLTIIFTVILFRLNGYNFHNGYLEIYRIFSDNNLDYIVAYLLLIKIILASIIMISFFAGIIILLSSIFKNKYFPAILISLGLIICTIIYGNFYFKFDFYVYKKRLNVFITTLIIVIMGILINLKLPDYLKIYSPFSYMSARYIANGAIKIKLNSQDANILLMFIVILIFTTVINIIGIILSDKTEQK